MYVFKREEKEENRKRGGGRTMKGGPRPCVPWCSGPLREQQEQGVMGPLCL